MLKNETVIRAEHIANQIIEWRRRLHRNPELSFKEYKTAAFVSEQLKRFHGINIKTEVAKTGVIGTLSLGEGPTIAIRADIDALPILEENEQDYKSEQSGVMHACGHDAHTAILLGVAAILSESFQKGELQGTVKLLFQPAEEDTDEKGYSGARYMVQEGVVDGVDAAIALHMCPWLPVGEVQINDHHSMANVDVFEGKIFGTGGHGAYPHLGTDPIWMLGPILQAIHGIVARKVSPLETAVISIGQVHAGTASNIIPTTVTIQGTIRSYTPEVREFLIKELENAFALAKGLGGNFELNVVRGEPALNNSPTINRWFKKTIAELYPDFQVKEGPFGMGGEDFGWITEKIPGSMFFLGCSLADGLERDLHTPIFDIDERCLPIGAAILAETVKRYLKGTYALETCDK